jgi:two-component system response regulator ResD
MSGATILVVEDEPSISEVVCLYLSRAGYQVLSAADGLEALNILDRQIPDLLVLDLMLPKIDGLKITSLLREHSDVPIIMLTARREEADRITGLEIGADDYVVKPFSPQELVSRVRAVLRRSHASPPESHAGTLTFPDLVIDPKTRLVTAQGREILLTVKEFDVLWLLACHPRQVFTRDDLLEQVWGLADYIDPSTVTVHIRRLREKIETNPSDPAHLLTVWGLGYKFEP